MTLVVSLVETVQDCQKRGDQRNRSLKEKEGSALRRKRGWWGGRDQRVSKI